MKKSTQLRGLPVTAVPTHYWPARCPTGAPHECRKTRTRALEPRAMHGSVPTATSRDPAPRACPHPKPHSTGLAPMHACSECNTPPGVTQLQASRMRVGAHGGRMNMRRRKEASSARVGRGAVLCRGPRGLRGGWGWRGQVALEAARERMHGAHLHRGRAGGGEERGKVAELGELAAVRAPATRELAAARHTHAHRQGGVASTALADLAEHGPRRRALATDAGACSRGCVLGWPLWDRPETLFRTASRALVGDDPDVSI